MARNVFCEVTVTLTFDHPPGVPEISHSREWDRLKGAVTLTFDHQHLISSSLSPSGCLCQSQRNSLKALLRYHVHKNEKDHCRRRRDRKITSIPNFCNQKCAKFRINICHNKLSNKTVYYKTGDLTGYWCYHQVRDNKKSSLQLFLYYRHCQSQYKLLHLIINCPLFSQVGL